MKIILGLLILIFQIFAFSEFVDFDSYYPIVYNIVDEDGATVSGQTVNLTIKTAWDNYFDFSDASYKSIGDVVTLQKALYYNSTDGYYYYNDWYPAIDSSTAPQNIILIFDNTDSTYGDHRVVKVDASEMGSGGSGTGATAQEVWEYTSRTLTTSPLTAEDVSTQVWTDNPLSIPTAEDISTQVWTDNPLSVPTAEDISTQVWTDNPLSIPTVSDISTQVWADNPLSIPTASDISIQVWTDNPLTNAPTAQEIWEYSEAGTYIQSWVWLANERTLTSIGTAADDVWNTDTAIELFANIGYILNYTDGVYDDNNGWEGLEKFLTRRGG